MLQMIFALKKLSGAQLDTATVPGFFEAQERDVQAASTSNLPHSVNTMEATDFLKLKRRERRAPCW